MRGTHGLAFIIFGALVWLARRTDIWVFRDIDPRVLQAIALLAVFGCALIVVRLLVRLWLKLNE